MRLIRLLVALLIFSAVPAHAITSLDATKPASNSTVSTMATYDRQTRLKINEVITQVNTLSATLPDGYTYYVVPNANNQGNAAIAGTLAYLINEIGADYAQIVMPDYGSDYSIASNVTVPINITLNVRRPFSVSLGCTLTINGPFIAPPIRIIKGAGTTTISTVAWEYPEWRGLGNFIDTDGTLAANSDLVLASQKAVKTFVGTPQGKVNGEYIVRTEANLIAAIADATCYSIKVVSSFALTGNRTVPVTQSLSIQGGAVITTGVRTLTLNGVFIPPGVRCFDTSGGGSVVFGPGSNLYATNIIWWYDGSTNFAASVNAANVAAKAGGIRQTYIPQGTYDNLNVTMLFRQGVHVKGAGSQNTTIACTGANKCMGAAEALVSTADNDYFGDLLSGVTLTAVGNTNDIALIEFDNVSVMFKRIYDCMFIGDPGQLHSGIKFTKTGGNVDMIYYNHITRNEFTDLYGTALDFDEGLDNYNYNINFITYNRFGGYHAALSIHGQGNTIENNGFGGGGLHDPVMVDNSGGVDFRIIICGSENILGGNYFDGAANTVVVKAIQPSVCPLEITRPNAGIIYTNQIADMAYPVVGGTKYSTDHGHLATFISGTSFSVAGVDVTATYQAGRKIWIDCGADGWRWSNIVSSTFAVDTTVVVNTSVITANLVGVCGSTGGGLVGDAIRSMFSTTRFLYKDFLVGILRSEDVNGPSLRLAEPSTFGVGTNTGAPVYGGISSWFSNHGGASYTVGKTTSGTSATIINTTNIDGGLSSIPTSVAKSVTGAPDPATEYFTVTSHGLVVGQRVTFYSAGGDPPPLVSGTRYYIIVIDTNTVQLASSLANAIAGTPIDVTGAGAGAMTMYTGARVGKLVVANGTSNTITYNPASNAASIIILQATNAAGATVEGSAKHLYVTAADGKFTVTTADGTNVAGPANFDYEILN